MRVYNCHLRVVARDHVIEEGKLTSDDPELTERGAGTLDASHRVDWTVLSVEEVLGLELFQDAVVLAGHSGLSRPVERLNVMSSPDILPWTKPHEFMLTTEFPLPIAAGELADLVRGLVAKDLSALGIKFGPNIDELPKAVLQVADELALPVVRIPKDVRFDDILSLVMSKIMNRQSAALLRAKEIHDTFLEVVLAGGRLVDITGRLSELLGGALVVVSDEVGRVLAPDLSDAERSWLKELGLADGTDRIMSAHLGTGIFCHAATGSHYLVSPVRVGNLGYGDILVVGGDLSFDQSVVVATEQAAIAVALDRIRQVATSVVIRQFEASILHEVMSGRELSTNEALIKSSSLDWDFDRNLVVIVSSMKWPPMQTGASDSQLLLQRHLARWTTEVRLEDRHAAAAFYADEFVAVVGVDGAAEAVPRSIWRRLKEVTGNEFSFGVSKTFSSQGRIPKAYEEARAALRVGLRVEGPGHLTFFNGIGLLRFLSLVDDQAELHAFVEDTLGRLLRVERPQRDDLVRTLEVLLAANMNVAAASRELHFHYNTTRYRISKLEDLVGPFTRDSQLALQISVALQALGMLEE